ncbi:hypothetical protein PINS_up008747 [Pythium insidiosum]|nr:hypothetical protein PINS_up008747 [Pythium insidiosum]
MMYSTPMIATGAERSVAELRLIFERASSPVDMHVREPIETMQVQEPVVAAEPASEPEPEQEQEQEQEHTQQPEHEQEPARELKKENENNETETETEIAAAAKVEAEAEAEPACNPESECEDATAVLSHERETASIVDDDAADERCAKMEEPLEPTCETGSDSGSGSSSGSGSDVAVAPMPRQACSSSKTRSLLRPPQVTRSAPRARGVASAVFAGKRFAR